MVRQGEKYQQFGKERWGSQQGKQATNPALLKKLTYDNATVTRTNLATFDNDATACYDRIVIPLTALRARQLGTHDETIHMLTNFLLMAQYHITTGHGTSPNYYKATEETPLHGPGQGSRAGPALWLIISTVLIAVYKKNASGLTFANPSRERQITRHTDCFVDDATLFCNQDQKHPKEELQRNAKQWEALLYSSGGALELSKCFYYILKWEFKNGTPTLAQPTSLTISLRNSTTGQQETIKEKATNESHRTLGVRLAPNGKWAEEKKYLAEKADHIAQRIRASQCRRDDARILEKCIYRPRMTYSLEVTTLTKDECQHIQTKAIQQILAASGFNRNLPRTVVFGPTRLGGLGFTHLYTEQGLMQIHSYIRHTRANDEIGQTMQILLDNTQLAAGISKHILQEPSRKNIQYTGSHWFNSMHKFLYENNLAISTPKAYLPKPRRINDQLLMDIAHETCQSKQIQQINACRLYLKVETVSDISCATGTHLQTQIRNGQKPNSRSPLTWPEQTCPDSVHWQSWRKFLQHIADDSSKLYQKLGDWTNLELRQWNYRYCHQENTVYTPTGYRTVTQKGRQKWTTIPTNQTHQTHWVPIEPCQHSLNAFYPPNKYLNKIEKENTWLDMFRQDSKTRTKEPSPSLTAASDGGHDQINDKASYGWIVANADTETIATGTGRAQGNPVSSFRAEAYGLLSLLVYLNDLPQKHNVTIYIDSKSLIKRLQRFPTKSPYQTMEPDADVVNTILAEKVRRHTINIEHVYSHQDRKINIKDLPFPAQLNTKADGLATEANDQPAKQFQTLIYHTYLYWNRTIQSKREKSVVRNAAHEKEIKEQILKTNPIKYRTDWKALGQARTQTPQLQTFTTKMIFNWLPTNAKQRQILNTHDDMCPYCKQMQETTSHVFTCEKHNVIPKLAVQITKQLETNPDQLEIVLTMLRNRPDSIIKGLLPEEWVDCYEKQWKVKMIRTIWTTAQEHWLERCKYSAELPANHTTAKITELYTNKDTMSNNDSNNIFYQTLPAILATTNTAQQQWLYTFKNIIQYTKQQAAATVNHARQSLFEVFSGSAGEHIVDSNQPSRG
jgi:hypothetical protein